MKGLNFRKPGTRVCKDDLFVITKEDSDSFAICVLEGNGK